MASIVALALAVMPLIADTGEARAAIPGHRAPQVRMTRLAAGVYAAIRAEPLSLAGNANSLIVVGQREVLVVDAQFTREATLETLAAIRAVTRNPVRWVVNTHWHDDHLAGNQVYRDTFPSVEFILHEHTRADVVALGRPNREATRTGAPPLLEKYQRQLDGSLGVDSTPASPPGREALTSALRVMRRYLAELPGFLETVDGISVTDRHRVRLDPLDVDVAWFGRGNTRGDLVVSVPSAGVVATGDLVVAPVPFAFGSHPREWSAVLDSVVALRPRVIVPGHGPILRDLGYVGRVRQMLRDLVTAVERSRGRGDSLNAVLREVTLPSHRAALTRDEKWATWMFDNFFRIPAIRAAFQDNP